MQKKVGGTKFFLCSLAQTPTSFCPKSCFLVSYCPSPSCIANLNLLASMAAEINGGSEIFLYVPLALPILVLKVVPWYVTPQAQVVYQI